MIGLFRAHNRVRLAPKTNFSGPAGPDKNDNFYNFVKFFFVFFFDFFLIPGVRSVIFRRFSGEINRKTAGPAAGIRHRARVAGPAPGPAAGPAIWYLDFRKRTLDFRKRTLNLPKPTLGIQFLGNRLLK